MNSLNIDLRNSIQRSPVRPVFLLITFALACFALSQTPKAFGVTPAPDGGYPNENTAEGDGALDLLDVNTGYGNTAVGFDALAGSPFAGNSGNYNTAVGDSALGNNGPASANTGVGYQALLNNLQGDNNTATGYQALYSNGTGMQNTANGVGALYTNNYGNYNTATGVGALRANYSGSNNTANGINSLLSNTNGGDNTATGAGALQKNVTGGANTANGSFALFSNTNGAFNTASGDVAMHNNTTGSSNTAVGIQALSKNISGSDNTALGVLAGQNLTTGNNNIDIGANVLGTAGESGKIRIGKQGTQNGTFIAGISGVAVTGSTVVVNALGKLGVAASSARYKQAVKPMDKASQAILALKPVIFRYKEELDPDGMPQFGLIAEEVEKVNPDLITRDEEGKPTTVRYEAVNAMLLNEFLKEHRQVQEQKSGLAKMKSTVARQEAIIERQQKRIEALTEAVRKVSDRNN